MLPVVHLWVSVSISVVSAYCLFAVQGSEVNFLLRRTAANQLLVWCSSSGWTPKPLVSVVDRTGSTVSTVGEPEVVLQADGLFSVSVGVNLEAVNGSLTVLNDPCLPALVLALCCPPAGPGNKSVICRVEVPHQLIKEKMIPIAGKQPSSALTASVALEASGPFLLTFLL